MQFDPIIDLRANDSLRTQIQYPRGVVHKITTNFLGYGVDETRYHDLQSFGSALEKNLRESLPFLL
ncbi:hypothetical protein GVX82_05155 [Patescibacteria group bacterium]|jgi:hypothetical protein|nr:hypothetical protein [Patescibacteria group bacterium]